jgi:hypothetical protein
MNGYHQPSLVALDPTDPDLMVAGGRDSGVFLSADGGSSWSTVTDPRTSHVSGTPDIPRPRFAYFDEEGGETSIVLGSQGRGIWRLRLGESAGLGLEVEGSCGGEVTLTVSNAPPNTEVALVAAANANGFIKGGALCNGTQLGIGEPFALPPTFVIVDGSGSGSTIRTLPANRCFVEALALASCETSGAIAVP